MPRNFRTYDQKQMLLLPPSLEDWVPRDSLARFVSELIDGLDQRDRLKEFYDSYRADGRGRAAYHPRLMLKVLLYGYCLGVTSSRKIARQLESDVCFRYLSGDQQPDFRTITDFRARHLEAFHRLFDEVLVLCMDSGLAKMGRVALDGRRVKANASDSVNRTKEELKKYTKEILEEAERVDREEDELYGDKRGDELPEDLQTVEGQRRRIQECLDRLEEREAKEQADYERRLAERKKKEKETGKRLPGARPKPPGEKKKKRSPEINLTDPDSRMMKSRSGWIQGFNGQAAVDCASQVIVGQGLTNQGNDRKQLKPMLEAIVEQSGRKPSQLLADAGYVSNSNLSLEDEETEFFIAQTSESKKHKAGPAPRGRPPKNLTPIERMRRKLLTKRGKAIYRDRFASVEGVFGQMWTRGLRSFSLRGLKRVRAEWALWCTTHNLLKLFRYGT